MEPTPPGDGFTAPFTVDSIAWLTKLPVARITFLIDRYGLRGIPATAPYAPYVLEVLESHAAEVRELQPVA